MRASSQETGTVMLECTAPVPSLNLFNSVNCPEQYVLTFWRCGTGLIYEDLQSSTSPRISTSQSIPPLINMRAPQLATAIKTNAINKLRILYKDNVLPILMISFKFQKVAYFVLWRRSKIFMRWKEKAYRALTERTLFPHSISPGTRYLRRRGLPLYSNMGRLELCVKIFKIVLREFEYIANR